MELYRSFEVRPTRKDASSLAWLLRERVDDIQAHDWNIISIDRMDNFDIYDYSKHYDVPGYIIIAKRTLSNEEFAKWKKDYLEIYEERYKCES